MTMVMKIWYVSRKWLALDFKNLVWLERSLLVAGFTFSTPDTQAFSLSTSDSLAAGSSLYQLASFNE